VHTSTKHPALSRKQELKDTKGDKLMRTLEQLADDLKIAGSVYSIQHQLKKTCKIKYDTKLTDEQWIATLEFIVDNYNYSDAFTMLSRLKRQQGA
jgi:hypothetical protein